MSTIVATFATLIMSAEFETLDGTTVSVADLITANANSR